MNKAIVIVIGVLVLGIVIEYPWQKEKEPPKEIINPLQWALAQHLRTQPKPGELEAYQEEARQELKNLNLAVGDVERMLASSTDAAVLKLGHDFQRQLPRWRSEYQRVIDGDFSDKAASNRYGARAWEYYWTKMAEKTKQDGMTMKNYYRIKDGMAVWEVDAILGRSGVEHSSAGNLKTYGWQEGFVQVVASFENGKLVAKTQVGLK